MSNRSETEDGMGFRGLVPTKVESSYEDAFRREREACDRFFKRSEQFRAALDKIANFKPHCSCPNSPRQYAIGVADGHRCAANIAKAAIADDSLAGLKKMGEQ